MAVQKSPRDERPARQIGVQSVPPSGRAPRRHRTRHTWQRRRRAHSVILRHRPFTITDRPFPPRHRPATPPYPHDSLHHALSHPLAHSLPSNHPPHPTTVRSLAVRAVSARARTRSDRIASRCGPHTGIGTDGRDKTFDDFTVNRNITAYWL